MRTHCFVHNGITGAQDGGQGNKLVWFFTAADGSFHTRLRQLQPIGLFLLSLAGRADIQSDPLAGAGRYSVIDWLDHFSASNGALASTPT